MTRELHGKVGIVTGGTSGIGRDAAVLFAKQGAKVVVAGRREVEGRETIELIRAAGGEGVFVKTDVSNAADVAALVQKTVEEFGRLDIAFNNAGVEGAWIPITEQSEEDWDRTIDINLKGVWLCLKHEIRQMLKQGGWRSDRQYGVRGWMDWFCGRSHLLREQAWSDGIDEVRRTRNRAKRHSHKCCVPGGDRNAHG